MQIANNNTIARVAAVVAGLGLVAMSFASFAPAAKAADTTADLQAQIAALLAQIAALQSQIGGSTTTGTAVQFNTDLTIGSTGADVTALQQFLVSQGNLQMPANVSYGYFGTLTQAALAKYQAAVGIAPAAGYFGPITRAKVNAVAGAGTGTGTGTGSTSGDLKGGAGSIDSVTTISSLSNEKVGEDEEDVEVAGVEVEVDDGSDIELTAVKLTFAKSTGATGDFEDYADSVSVMLDGEEVARVDADAFNDDNSYSKTVSLDKGAIIRAGDKADLTIAVSGARVIDSADIGDAWTLDIESLRFVDATGASITETVTFTARSFTFASFATAANAELKIAEDDSDINDARTIEVDDTNDTDNVDVLSFTLEAEGDSDLEIKNWGVSVTVSESNTDDVINNLSLWIDGEEIVSADTVSSAGATEFYNFDDVNYTIDAGDTVDVVVKADFNDIESSTFDEGTTISFALGEEQTDVTTVVDVEDESGEQLADGDITGSVSSGDFELRSTGIMVTFISASESVTAADTADTESGTFKIKFNVEAFGGTVVVGDTAAPTIAATIPDTTIATDGIRYLLDEAGTATATLVTDAVEFTTSGGASDTGITNGVQLTDGEDTDMTLTVIRTNAGGPDNDGLFRVLLKAIGWATTDTSTYNVYDFNLEDYKTSSVYVD